MKVKVFPGCVITNRLPFIEKSARYVFNELGIEFEDAPFSCCPDPVGVAAISEKVWLTLGARNLCLAQQSGMKIVSLCNGCAETLIMVKNRLEKDKNILKEINGVLEKKGYKYTGGIEVDHFIKTLICDVGIENIEDRVKKPLKSLKIAPHPGCHYSRPSDEIGWDDPFEPKYLKELIRAVGAEPIEYDEEMLCCASALARTREDLALELNRRKYESMVNAGAECIAVNCPSCFQALENGQRVVNRKFGTEFSLPVFYITELMALSFGADPKSIGLKFHSVKTTALLKKYGIM